MTIAVVAFVCVVLVICGPYWALVVRPESQAHALLRSRLKTGTRKAHAIRQSLLKEAKQLSAIGPLNALLGRVSRVLLPLQRLIDQSGVHMTVGMLVLTSGCALLLTLLLVITFTSQPMLGLAIGAAAGMLPYAFVARARTKRMLKFEEYFPEAIDLIARALRAGHALPTGLSMVAEELPNPVGPEFRTVYDQQNFGIPLPDALRGFAARVPVLDARFFVTAVLTQREAGGNLAEVLDNLSAVIRERFKVKRQVRVISAHGRITGWVLAGLPPCLALAFFVVSPNHMQTLINDPLGVKMLIGAVVLQVLGTLVIRKIVTIEY